MITPSTIGFSMLTSILPVIIYFPVKILFNLLNPISESFVITIMIMCISLILSELYQIYNKNNIMLIIFHVSVILNTFVFIFVLDAAYNTIIDILLNTVMIGLIESSQKSFQKFDNNTLTAGMYIGAITIVYLIIGVLLNMLFFM
jgi:hypothetical protein